MNKHSAIKLPIFICMAFIYLINSSYCMASDERISLCDVHEGRDDYIGQTVRISGNFSASYHISYLNSPQCPNYWFLIRLGNSDHSEAAEKYKSAMRVRNRMIGGDYRIEIYGKFYKFSDIEKKYYSNYEGYFLVSDFIMFEPYSDER